MTRIVHPGEAQRLLDTPTSIPGSSDWDYSYTNTYLANFLDAGPDLAHTVIQQAEQIETLSSLLAGAEKAAIDRSEQIKRLQKALRQAHEDEFIAGLDRYPTLVYEAPAEGEWHKEYPNLHEKDMQP